MAQGEGGGYMSSLKNKISKKLNLLFHSERLVGWLAARTFILLAKLKRLFSPLIHVIILSLAVFQVSWDMFFLFAVCQVHKTPSSFIYPVLNIAYLSYIRNISLQSLV